jgi:endonuclease YncB( thermonuclease family)
MRSLFTSLLLIVAPVLWIRSGDTTGTVTAVIDGNTLEVQTSDNETYKITLADVDSPELTQPYGEAARKYLRKLLLEKNVTVHFKGKDRKGNHIAVVMKGDVDARIPMLREGLAWTSEKDPIPELEAHRATAQQKGKGLWHDANPTPPWIYRREQSMIEPKSS